MKSDQYKHVSAVTLLAFFLIATWSAAPGRSSAAASPPGIARLALNCPGPVGCNGITVLAGILATQPVCRLPVTFTVQVNGGIPRDTAPRFLISVLDPALNPVPVTITSPDGIEATFVAELAGTYIVTAQDKDGCSASTGPPSGACYEVSTLPCCSLTQDEYGSCTNRFDNFESLKIVQCLNRASSDPNCFIGRVRPLQVGMSGSRSLTFSSGSERCLIEKLPAGGPPNALLSGLGDAVITSPTSPSTCQLPADCQFPTALPINSAGKFNNALIGHTVALTLNAALDSDIGGTILSKAMVTHRVLPRNGLLGYGGEQFDPGPDGVLGTADDPITIVTIPGSVISAIAAGSPLEMAGKFFEFERAGTVSRVLKLANFALAGEPNLGATAVEINAAVAAINRAFDQCSFVTRSFSTDTCLQNDDGLLSFNSMTGEYVFTRCGPGGFSITGTGAVTRRGCTITLQNNLSDRRILVTVDTCQKRGTASGQVFSRGLSFSISDTNTTDNLCACP